MAPNPHPSSPRPPPPRTATATVALSSLLHTHLCNFINVTDVFRFEIAIPPCSHAISFNEIYHIVLSSSDLGLHLFHFNSDIHPSICFDCLFAAIICVGLNILILFFYIF
jgi:hypothetical protein